MLALAIYPEGTTTSGDYILKFKKGAFASLLPLKPLVMINNLDENFHLSGMVGMTLQFARAHLYLYHNIRIYDLPVVTPNDFMYAKYRETHPELTEKWEIYAEVMRDIMCEYSGLKKSNMNFRDSLDYESLLFGLKDPQIILNEKKNL